MISQTHKPGEIQRYRNMLTKINQQVAIVKKLQKFELSYL